MGLNKVEVNSSAVYDNKLPMLTIFVEDFFLGLVNVADEFEGNLILEIDCEMGEEEDTFLDDPNVGFQHELLFESLANVVQKLAFLVAIQGGGNHL